MWVWRGSSLSISSSDIHKTKMKKVRLIEKIVDPDSEPTFSDSRSHPHSVTLHRQHSSREQLGVKARPQGRSELPGKGQRSGWRE